MSEPVFERAGAGLDLYWLTDGTRRAGFRASATAALGDQATLSETWTDAGGSWIWLDEAPSGDDAAFAAALESYLALLAAPQGPRLLWIAGAAGDMYRWRVASLDTARATTATTVAGGGRFDLGGNRIAMAGGAAVDLADAAAGWGFSVSGTPALTLFAADGVFTASGAAVVTYADGLAGCWRWAMDLTTVGTDDTVSDLHRFGASLRFFAPDAGDGSIRVLRLDVLRPTSALTLYAAADPLAPLDPLRTRFSLFAPGAVTGSGPGFDTGYVTARGGAVTLQARLPATGQPAPGFVFAIQPLAAGADGAAADVPRVLYPTPDGDFDLLADTDHSQAAASDGAPAARLLCGMAGLEYVGLPAATGTVLSFRAGRAAYAPPLAALTTLGTTAWVWPGAEEGTVRYYAQPEEAPFYAAAGEGFLGYLEMAAATLATTEALPAFPMAGYAGLDAGLAPLARDLEARSIAPERRHRITLLTRAEWESAASGVPATLPAVTTLGVSPSGLAVGWAGDDQPWAWLGFGNTGDPGLPNLQFTAVGGAFRQAVLSNRLFMVLGSADAVMANGSVAYALTGESLGLIAALPTDAGVPADVLSAVSAAVAAAGYPTYPTETAFDAMLTGAVPAITAGQKLIFQRVAGQLSPQIGDWPFRLSPRNWAAADRSGPRDARLIFKFVSGRSLRDLVSDIAVWRWPEASSADGLATTARDDILDILRAADEAAATAREAGSTSPYDRFRAVVDDPNWTGVLALSVEVPLDTLPAALQPLAAGIAVSGFYGHHLGLTATSFSADGGSLVFGTTSSFGLIDYQNSEDQYFASDIAFAFRVQQLTVGFENGKLSSFSSRAQLMINRLFGAETRLFPSEHGNNLIFSGVCQSASGDGSGDDGDQTFVFAMEDAGAFQLAQGQLSEVALTSAQLVTTRAADPASGETTITAVFQMSGRLRFAEPDSFDPFCWGPPATSDATAFAGIDASDGSVDATGSDGLAFSNYAVTMSFPLSDPTAVQFAVDDGNVTLDAANSVARTNSLFARFPLRLTALLSTPDPAVTGSPASLYTPGEAGYVSISAPVTQGTLSQPWYGLVYEVDLGTLGALAGSVKVSMKLLAAWSAGGAEDEAALYIGAALPGVERLLGVNLPLQGILDIGFRTLQFKTYTDADNGERQYILKLRDFALRLFGLSFPPGHNDIALFGNPDQTSNTKLGWYAAYDSGTTSGATGGSTTLAVPGERRRRLSARTIGTAARRARPARLT